MKLNEFQKVILRLLYISICTSAKGRLGGEDAQFLYDFERENLDTNYFYQGGKNNG